MWHAWERNEKCTRFWWESPKEIDHLEGQGVGGKTGSEWILGNWLGGYGLDSTGSGQGPVAGCCECGDEPSGSCPTELVSYTENQTNPQNSLFLSKKCSYRMLKQVVHNYC
jgi:hypothetical protein